MLGHDVHTLEREEDAPAGRCRVEQEDASIPEFACPDDRLSGVADDLEVGAEGIPDAGDLVDADPDVVGAHRGDDDTLPVELCGASVGYLVGAHVRAGHAEGVSHGVVPTSRSKLNSSAGPTMLITGHDVASTS